MDDDLVIFKKFNSSVYKYIFKIIQFPDFDFFVTTFLVENIKEYINCNKRKPYYFMGFRIEDNTNLYETKYKYVLQISKTNKTHMLKVDEEGRKKHL